MRSAILCRRRRNVDCVSKKGFSVTDTKLKLMLETDSPG